MRKGVLGTIAALTAGAGIAWGQAPKPNFVPPPTPVAPSMLDPNVVPASAPHVGGVIAPPIGPDMGPGYPAHYGVPTTPEMGPGYPAGYNGQPGWESASSQGTNSLSKGVESYYLNARLLLWFVKAQPANVPFLTTSAPGDLGVIGRPTTRLLHADRDLGYNIFTGFHINGGFFRDPEKRWGFDFGGLMLEQKKNEFFGSSDPTGIPVIARPFIEATTGQNAVLTVAQQGLSNGSVNVITSNQIYGAEANVLMNLYRSCPDDACKITINSTFGFRFLEIDEDLSIHSQSFLLGGGDPRFNGIRALQGAALSVFDSYDAVNRFYGGQAGVNANIDCGRWSFGFNGKLAVGLMNQVIDIDGRSAILDIERRIAAQAIGGLYANSLNIGRYRNDEFGILTEIGTSVGYQWTSWFSTAVGYNFLYTNRALRPGNAVSNRVNSSLLPTSTNFGTGAVTPVANPALTQDDFWAQGVTLTMIWKF